MRSQNHRSTEAKRAEERKVEEPVFDFPTILENRKQLRANTANSGNLKQGIQFPGLSVSPYSFSESFQYVKGLLWGDSVSKNECQSEAPIGKHSIEHCVGVRQGVLKKGNDLSLSLSKEEEVKLDDRDDKKIKIIFSGDIMVSESGIPIQLGAALLNEIKSADALVINVESPVNFKEDSEGRKGLTFAMSQSYLASFARQIYQVNDKIKIIYNIANNHALDGSDSQDPSQFTEEENALFAEDQENYILLRTISAIHKADNNAIIIGAHLSPRTDEIAVIEKDGFRVGILGFTDILNHNASYWDRRVLRSEDLPDDINELKEKCKLDYLYLYGHGNLEQNIYPTKHWRDLAIQFLNRGADGFIGHGPHVPQTNEILNIANQDKLLVHSVGNFFGPKNLSNTGLNLLAVMEFDKSTARFAMKPIHAVVNEQMPCVDSVDGSHTPYPNLLRRIDRLYPQEEKIFRKYHADQLDCAALLGMFNQVIEKQDKSSPIYEAALAARQEGESLSRAIPESKIKKWKMSVVLAINVLDTPKDKPEHQEAIRLLKENAEHHAIGKEDGWKKFKGALAILAGAALIGLSLVGIPFTGGASLGLGVAGGLLIVSGMTLFYRNRQKSLAQESSILAKEASINLTRLFPEKCKV